MNSKTVNILKIAIALIILLVAIFWLAGVFTSKIEPGLLVNDALTEKEGFVVESATYTILEEVPGNISAEQATRISSRILARITTIHVRAGDTVEQGQLLAELESQDLESRLRQAGQQVISLQARVTESQQSLQRIESLFEDGVVARAELDRAQANFNALSADIAQAEQAADEANTMLNYTKIIAPINGRIIDRFADPGDTATPGSTLLSIYNPLSLQAVAKVREQLATTLSIGSQVDVEIPSLKKRIHATIQEIVPAANPTSRSFEIKARFQFESNLMPGMYARLYVPAGEEDLIAIPEEYITEIGQLNMVWVAGDKKIEERFIRTGKQVGPGLVAITAGLTPGDILIPRHLDNDSQ